MASYRVPDHCTPTSLYLLRLSSAFTSCIPTPLAFVSTSLGVFSIVSWLFAQVPQIYKNYQLQSASGLSIFFLAEWLLGDLTDLLGALLTGQATWQKVLASYYVTVDVLLCYQYFWYTHMKPWQRKRIIRLAGDGDREDDSTSDVLVGVSLSDGSSIADSTTTGNGKATTKALDVPTKTQARQDFRTQKWSFSKEKGTPSSDRTIVRETRSPSPIASPRTLLLVSMLCVVLANGAPLHADIQGLAPPVSNAEFAGRIFSWSSTLLYLGSRFPQIYKNAIRRSTAGLSPTLFIAAFCGNFFYSASLLTNPLAWSSYPPYGLHGWVGPEGSERKTWVALAAPFWLGAAGVLLMDATIGVQFLVYGESLEISQVLVKDREGRSKWRTVSGWMRGWIPSLTPTAKDVEVVEESSRPLLNGQGGHEGSYGTA